MEDGSSLVAPHRDGDEVLEDMVDFERVEHKVDLERWTWKGGLEEVDLERWTCKM